MDCVDTADFLQYLPPEILFMLFEMLPVKDVLRLRQVNRRLWVIGRDTAFWKLKCRSVPYGSINTLSMQYGYDWEWVFRTKAVDIDRLELRLLEIQQASMELDSELPAIPNEPQEWVGFRKRVESGQLTDTVIIQQGRWRAGKLDGYGMLIHDSAAEELAIYEGMFNNGEFIRGRIWYGSGGGYFGECSGLKRHGRGKYNYKNGNVYEGEWKHSFRHGQGTMLYKRDPTHTSNGTTVEGSKEKTLTAVVAQQNMPEMYIKYEGHWLEGVFHGNGTMNYVGGEVYVGEWYRGKRHGTGTLYGADGRVLYSGRWERGKLPGEGSGASISTSAANAGALLMQLAMAGSTR